MSREPVPPSDDAPPPVERARSNEQRSADRRAVSLRRALDRRIAAVLESVTHAFLALDAAWRVTYANPEAARLNGTTPDALIGRDHWTIWPETLGSEVERRYRRAVAEMLPAHFVHHYPAADRWHEIHAYPVDDGGLAILYRDITTEREAESERARLAAALAERERELAAVLDNATDVVARFDCALRFTYANPALERAVGLAPDAVIGRSHDDLPVPREYAEAWNAALSRVVSTGRGEALGFDHETSAGRRHFEARCIPEFGADGSVGTVLTLTRDVTERVRGEQALAAAVTAAQAARAEAESANAAKSAFLATMSHELRTPLNAIRGYADLLALGVYGPVTDAQRAALGRIGQSERHLLGVITEILDYARLESGRARYNVAEVSLDSILADARALVDPQLRAKGIAFAYEPPDANLSVVVRADAGKLRQIVLNLLSNALKFTPSGGQVTLRGSASGATAAVDVCDSGRGVPAEELGRIFEPFVQLARGETSSLSGAGLGLAISREFARGMGGDLTAESTLGRGSTFRVTVPRVSPAA